ncbi:hypothetical protein AMK68_03730, partial [candidate division KD3-62 bacterium DG_56]
TIVRHFEELDFWQPIWQKSAVVIAGSAARGIEDEFTDIDINVFVPSSSYARLYEHYVKAVEDQRVEVLNPAAFEYKELPLALMPAIRGHYKVHTFEEAEDRVARCEDVAMWVHRNSLVLHDPSGRYAALQKKASDYPEDVWRERVRFHYLEAWMAASAASNPLRRNDRPAVTLTMTKCLRHLLRLCCLLDRRPFPYDKWLYREALQTQAGRDLKHVFDRFFAEISRPEIQRIVPDSYERPGHRNADLEEFPLYMIWRQAKRYFDERLPGRTA